MGERSALGISDLLRRSAGEDAGRLAVVDGADRLTRAELDALVNGIAAGLAGRGLRPGDRVGLQLPTGVPFVAAYLGALRAGLIAVPVNPAAAARRSSTSGPTPASRSIWTSRRRANSSPTPGGPPDRPSPVPGGRVAPIPGPTGRATRSPYCSTPPEPAGAPARRCCPAARCWPTSSNSPRSIRRMITAADVLFVPLPLSHVFGLNAGLGMALHVGCDRWCWPTASMRAASLQTMADEGVTAVLGVPGQYAQWLRAAGGARDSPSAVRDVGFDDARPRPGRGLRRARCGHARRLRADRGGAGRHRQRHRSARAAEARVDRAPAARSAGPAARRRRRGGRPRRSRADLHLAAQPVLRLLARRRRRAGCRRLVRHGRHRGGRRRWRAAPGRPGHRSGHRQRVQRLSGRGRGGVRAPARVSRKSR